MIVFFMTWVSLFVSFIAEGKNPFVECGVHVLSERKLIPYEETIDPYLIQKSGGEVARRGIFRQIQLSHHDKDFETFKRWYYSHFSWQPYMKWSFKSWYKVWDRLMTRSWIDLQFSDIDKASTALKMDLSHGELDFLWSLIRDVQSHPRSLKRVLELIQEQEKIVFFQNFDRDDDFKYFFQLIVNRILHSQLSSPLQRGESEIHLETLRSLTSQRQLSIQRRPRSLYRKHQGTRIPIWDWKKPLNFHIKSPQRYVVRLLVRGPMTLNLKGGSPSLHVRWQEWGQDDSVVEQPSSEPFYIPKAGFYKFEFASLVSQTFYIETHCRGRSCSLPTQHYPVVFLHGLAGKKSYLGLINYWRSAPEALRKEGYSVEFPFVQAIAHSKRRATSWVRAIKKILKKTGAHKVHLVGHSQGGIDARLLSSGWGLGQNIASITTLSTPHHGVDFLFSKPFFTGMDFRPKAMNIFNQRYPDPSAIPTLSYSGRTRVPGQAGDMAVALPMFWFFEYRIRQNHSSDPYRGANDGLVPRASSQWGCSVGVIEADHLQQVWGSSTYDPVTFFRQHLDDLIDIEALSEDFIQAENKP
ncbi:MAG: esterase/lipase family protein [Oligoflexales bacterium]